MRSIVIDPALILGESIVRTKTWKPKTLFVLVVTGRSCLRRKLASAADDTGLERGNGVRKTVFATLTLGRCWGCASRWNNFWKHCYVSLVFARRTFLGHG
jgi:hypothetical protein